MGSNNQAKYKQCDQYWRPRVCKVTCVHFLEAAASLKAHDRGDERRTASTLRRRRQFVVEVMFTASVLFEATFQELGPCVKFVRV